jgi:hypothetical protein
MAVAVKQRFSLEAREFGVFRILVEKFAEQERLLAESSGALVVREEVDEFVAEDGDAARFEADDGNSGFDFGLQFVEDVEEQSFGTVEHAEVVERASAAEMGARDYDAEAGGFEDFDCGFGGVRLEIVVEGVGPEKHRGD